MPRALDLLLVICGLIVLAIPMALIALLVKVTSPGPVLYWSDRVGRDNRLFAMPKFRTMRIGTPVVATHLLVDGRNHLTPVGSFLRRTSLDELPQLWSVLRGDMGMVGPRPALFNQDDLVAMRTERGVHRLRPGVTGWAQVNGRDDLTVPGKVALDEEYLRCRSSRLDARIIWMTCVGVFTGKGVAH